MGEFEKNVLKSGKLARVKSERCLNGFKTVVTSETVKMSQCFITELAQSIC